MQAVAERNRIAAIRSLPEAVGRENLAMTLATTTDMSVDQIKTALAAAPIDAAAVSALWSASLASRGMNVGAVAPNASTDDALWTAALTSRGMQVKDA
ncbi:hypothetical protein XI09_40965 [Bradyrhizobium sp. CCBAU 11386]|uniref:hypothetical protein n=1 Tax=Bradyrhizobium sp. CCBAU 11386 TaxID=1630837 RepID=UPI0023045FCA|nr:hypothetical protein [Bradyrhizobium sp. CCBAU 11386]MDA9510922.1 hypothetical protein [Bradyrhizobium sp. CCBAU 11386]